MLSYYFIYRLLLSLSFYLLFQTFFEVLETTDESRKELIHVRIEDSINDFSKEASRLLPEPDLLQVKNHFC